MSLSACGGTKKTNNTEFDEYKRIVTSVINKYTQNDKGKNIKTSNSSDSFSAKPMSVSTSVKDEMLNIMEACQDKESTELYNFYNDVFEQSFYIPLICGDAITEYHSSKVFYDVSIYMPFWGQYVLTRVDGTHKITYVYTEADNNQRKENFIYIDLDYTDADNFRKTHFFTATARVNL
mgnify:CR=1 FL=1